MSFYTDNFEHIFSKEELDFFNKKVEEAEKMTSVNDLDLNYFMNVEKHSLKYIDDNISSNKKKIHKKFLYKYLKFKFFSNKFEKRKKLLLQIQYEFYLFLNNLKSLKDINTISKGAINFPYSVNNKSLNDYQLLSKNLKELKSLIWKKCLNYILEKRKDIITLITLPNFILFNEKKILTSKIEKIISIDCEIPILEIKVGNNPIFQYLDKSFQEFYDGKLEIFHNNLFSDDELKNIFKVFILSNKDYLNYDNIREFFLKNLKKYVDLMNISNEYNNLKDEIIQKLFDNNLIDKLDESMKITEPLLEGKVNEKLYLMLMGISLIMKGLLMFNENKHIFVDNLICSSLEKEFLKNFFNFIDNYIYLKTSLEKVCSKANYMLENLIFSNLLKSYTKGLYDENNKGKKTITFEEIYKSLNISKFLQVKEIENTDIIDKSKTNLFNAYSVEENKLLENQFSTFINKNSSLFIHSSQKESFFPSSDNSSTITTYKSSIQNENNKKKEFNFNSLFSKFKNTFSSIGHKIISTDNYINSLTLNNLTIQPLEPFNSYTNICICISGYFLPQNSKFENIWENLLLTKNNMDYYYYNWQDEDNFYKTGIAKNTIGYLQHFFDQNSTQKAYSEINDDNMYKMVKNNKRISKLYGKFLAYIIASKLIFKYQTISFIGFSLGCNVIKFCLKELNKIRNCGLNINDIINDIIFICGGCKISENEKHKEMLSLISGKIINVYCDNDELYKKYYSEKSIGIRKLLNIENDDNKIYYPKIENINLSNYKMREQDYKYEIPGLLKETIEK